MLHNIFQDGISVFINKVRICDFFFFFSFSFFFPLLPYICSQGANSSCPHLPIPFPSDLHNSSQERGGGCLFNFFFCFCRFSSLLTPCAPTARSEEDVPEEEARREQERQREPERRERGGARGAGSAKQTTPCGEQPRQHRYGGGGGSPEALRVFRSLQVTQTHTKPEKGYFSARLISILLPTND